LRELAREKRVVGDDNKMTPSEKCRVCGGKLSDWHGLLVGLADDSMKDWIVYPYRILRCSKCGMIYTKKVKEEKVK